MQCAACLEQLSEFLDGDLDDGGRRDIVEHLRSCTGCSTVKDDLARLIAASASLPLHTPSPALWTRIERELAGNVVRGPSAWWDHLSARRFDFSVTARQIVTAAATILVVAGAVWTIRYASPNALPSVDVNWNTMGGSSPAVQATPLAHVAPVDEVERVRGLVDEMARSVAETESSWSPELRATFRKALAAADARIADGERGLAATPTDATREALLVAYREKLTLLDEFGRLAAKAGTVRSN